MPDMTLIALGMFFLGAALGLLIIGRIIFKR